MPHRDVTCSHLTTSVSMNAPRIAGLLSTAVLLPFGLASLWRATHLHDLALDFDPFEIDLQLRDRNDD